MDILKKVPVREQDAQERAKNFEEVCLGYNKEEAMEEASRCINCKNAQCVKGCPVAINIPGFVTLMGLIRPSASPARCPPCAAAYVPRRASARANVSGASRVSRCPSASWSALWRTMPGNRG